MNIDIESKLDNIDTSKAHLKINAKMSDKKLKEVSEDFESIFINMLFKSMRKTLDEKSLIVPKGEGQKIFEDLLYTEYSKTMSKSGKFGIADLIYKQFKAKKALKKSVAGVIFKDNSIFLAKRKGEGDMANYWELVGGKVEDFESLEEALKREFLEELSVKIKILRYLCSTIFINKNKEIHLSAFEINLLQEIKKTPEHLDYGYFSKDELKNLSIVPSDLKIIKKLNF